MSYNAQNDVQSNSQKQSENSQNCSNKNNAGSQNCAKNNADKKAKNDCHKNCK